MARPPIPEEERREHALRPRLTESDAMALRRKARMLGIPVNTLAMVILHTKINGLDDTIKFSMAY